MSCIVDLEDQIEKSARKLRAWDWMSTISTRPEEAVALLSQEARYLVDLGLKHPDDAKRIGTLIVFYQRLIRQLKRRVEEKGLSQPI